MYSCTNQWVDTSWVGLCRVHRMHQLCLERRVLCHTGNPCWVLHRNSLCRRWLWNSHNVAPTSNTSTIHTRPGFQHRSVYFRKALIWRFVPKWNSASHLLIDLASSGTSCSYVNRYVQEHNVNARNWSLRSRLCCAPGIRLRNLVNDSLRSQITSVLTVQVPDVMVCFVGCTTHVVLYDKRKPWRRWMHSRRSLISIIEWNDSSI